MFRLILIINVIFLAATATVAAPEIVIAAGTQMSITNDSVIDSGSMKPGDDANFTLSQDVKGTSGTIPKGSVIFGRVVEAEKFSGGKSLSKLVLMFDFLQVGEDFYPMSAIILSSTGAKADMQMKKLDNLDGCTAVTLKGADFSFPEGTTFVIKTEADIES